MPGRVTIRVKGSCDAQWEEQLIGLVANLVTGSKGREPTAQRQDDGYDWTLDESNDYKASIRPVEGTDALFDLAIFWRYGGGGNARRMEVIGQHVAYALNGDLRAAVTVGTGGGTS
jgi:hypothetical protein